MISTLVTQTYQYYHHTNCFLVFSTIEEGTSGKLPSSDGNPDAFTNQYINSLRVRSDVKTALKTHLDSLNCDHDKSDQHLTDRLSEANLSMATSEISNCDSKDVAELDSMLSTSPHHNGHAHDYTELDNDVSRTAADVITNNDVICNSNHGDVTDNVTNDVTHNNDATHNDVSHNNEITQISPVAEDDKELSSVEKSKRVLFSDDRDILDQGKN